MTDEKVKKLIRGLYRIYWNGENGTSVCSVGDYSDGSKWFAPTGWINKPGLNPIGFGKQWRKIKRMELICIE